MPIDYDGVVLSGHYAQAGMGKLRMIDQGIGFKNKDTNAALTLPASEVKKVTWFKGVRGPTIRIVTGKGESMDFESLPRDSFEELQTTVRQYYNVALESKEYSIKGWNWGSYEFQGSNLNFIVNNKPAFEIPLGDVSNSMVAGKNEVSLEFGTEDAAKKSSRNDELMEIRFYVPGAAKKESGVDDGEKKIKAEREDGAEGTEDGEEGGDDDVLRDEDGEEISAAQLFSDTVKEKADISALTGEPIMAFDDLLCLTPRGRFEVAFYSAFFRLRGRTQDYRINYSAVKRIFLLPKPEDLQHYFFVLNVEPPIRQGQTRYPYLVFQLNAADEVEGMAPNMDVIDEEHKEQFSRLLEDLPDPAKPHYDVEIFKVISHVFAVATNQKVITDKETADILWEKYPREVSNFTSIAGRVKAGIKCTYKANEAYLYPLGPAGKCFLSLFKQPMSIPFRDIASITCSRVAQGTGAAALRTFEIRIAQRNGPDLTFGNVSRDDYPALEEFAKKYSIKVRAEMAEDTRVLFGGEGQDDSASEEEGGSRKRKRTTINAEDFGDDEDSDEEDEDFNPEAKKAKGDDSEQSGSGSGSDSDESGSDSDSGSGSGSESEKETKRKEKPSKEKEPKPKKAPKAKKAAEEGTKKKRKKKDKNAPKKNKTAFLFFSNDKRQQVKDENPNIEFKDMGKKLGEMWKAASAEDKKQYEEMAEKDKERYKREMASYVPPESDGEEEPKKKEKKAAKPSAKPTVSKLSEEKVRESSSSGSESGSGSGSDSD